MLKLLLCSAIVGLALSQDSSKTNGQVKECFEKAVETCLSTCQSENTDVAASSFEAAKLCISDGHKAREQCLKDQGITIDDTQPCFAPPHGGPRGSHPRHQRSKSHSGSNSKEAPKALKCLKKCKKESHRKCTEGCTGSPPSGPKPDWRSCKAKSAFKECMAKAFPAAAGAN